MSVLQYRITVLLLTVLMALISGCAKPLPETRSEYLGHWRGADIELSIFADGTLAYRRNSKGVKTEINGPITEFKGHDIVVGVWFLTTTFVISEPPHPVDGQWQMVVDGVRLTRIELVPGQARQQFTCSACSPIHVT